MFDLEEDRPARIPLLPSDREVYGKRIGKSLRQKRDFQFCTQDETKYSLFASHTFNELRRAERPKITESRALPSFNYSIDEVLEKNDPKPPPFKNEKARHAHIKAIRDMELSAICNAYSIEDVIGYNLFNLDPTNDRDILQYKAFELLAKQYYQEKRLFDVEIAHVESLHDKQRVVAEKAIIDKAKNLDKLARLSAYKQRTMHNARLALQEATHQLDREFRAYL